MPWPVSVWGTATIENQPNVITPDERAGVQTGEVAAFRGTGWCRIVSGRSVAESAPPFLALLGCTAVVGAAATRSPWESR